MELPLNYPLIGAAGYSGMMVWHGGLSGSSLTKVAETGHLKKLVADFNPDLAVLLPNQITFAETVFSPMNIVISAALIVILPLALYRLGKNSTSVIPTLNSVEKPIEEIISSGAERLDYSKWVGIAFGLIVLLVAMLKLLNQNSGQLLFFFYCKQYQPSFIELRAIISPEFFSISKSTGIWQLVEFREF